MNDKILKLFARAIPVNDKIPTAKVFRSSAKLGYLVHPSICQADVLQWINSQQYNPNSTFYKTWEDVLSKDRIELLVDQLLHYFSTYGTNFTASAYKPNHSPAVVDFSSYKVILPITEAEVVGRCKKMLYSGIALKQETIEDIFAILVGMNHVLDIAEIKNREAKMIYFDKLDLLPNDAVEMMRFLVYKSTGSTMLIKSKEVFEEVSAKQLYIGNYVSRFGYEKLAAVFYRFKPIFLAFRKTESNRVVVNKLRKLAVMYHQPVGKPFVETILSDSNILASLPEKIDRLNNFKKVQLLQAILIRKKHLNTRAFVIRNQKLWMKEEVTKVSFQHHYHEVYDMIYQSLVNSLQAKACTVGLPDGINLTLPASEKSFIGNFPLGTSFDLTGQHTIVGINWRSADGADDLDLSLVDVHGSKIGWNADYANSNNSLVYSGDMTSADPEATELIYASEGFTDGIIKVNLFSGNLNSKLRLFVARENIPVLTKNYMVDPDNILFTIEAEMDSREKSFAVINSSKLILAQFKTGKGKVSGESVTNKYTVYALDTIDCYLSLAKVLEDAGFEITDDAPDIDLRELSKDSLIDLLMGVK